jgi:2'-5' RNA ligase
MTVTGPISGVVVRVSLPPALARIRSGDDLAASAGAPPHITILYPFLPVAILRPAVRRELVGIAAMVEPFDVSFGRVGRFPGAIYLIPEPSAPFVHLTAAIVTRFPGYLPYEGAFDEVVPHLTLVESATAPLGPIAEAAERHLPFRRRIAALELLVESGDGRWHGRWRIPLGVRP